MIDHRSNNVLPLIIPARNPARRLREPAPVIPLHPGRLDERRGAVLALIGMAVMLALALVAFVFSVRATRDLPTAQWFGIPW